jgi:hypothetical protein
MKLDKIENLSLIENCCLHLQFELSRKNPSYFRIAMEAHLLLYRSMIEALKGTANIAVTGRRSKDRSYKYQRNGKPWQEIHKESIEGCKKAWRFSQPAPYTEPQLDNKLCQEIKSEDYLISFYDALAMIQTDCFMNQYMGSRYFIISDADMKKLEWLHEDIRNEYEHFVPKTYLSPKNDLASAATLCLQLSHKLLFESDNILFFNSSHDDLDSLFKDIFKRLK